MKKIKWLLAMIVAMVLSMSMVSFAGVYGSTNEECYYNQEWRNAFSNYCNQILKSGDDDLQIYWLDNENDHSQDKVVAISYDQSMKTKSYGFHRAIVMYPSGRTYTTCYKNGDGSYSDANELVNWRGEIMRLKDLNEFSRFAPAQ
ncbi:hypothetical protein SAMN04487771_100313 [[Clostridium] aminophilum]|uniref:Uncharacterized protein n=1 Tax=[Clostridium] aminophilum TaxID=1526 RepID=A0A1I0AXH8_9FIRM|nr:hypothetical protein [[Clostridium] aminophilum]SES99103.1 hypothetical protein SAMN04487771_100313 [[Clostridium] aminophilum]